MGFITCLNTLGQIKSIPQSVPFSNKAGNTMWLTNLTAEEVKAFYLDNIKFKPEKVVSFSEKTSNGFKMYYKHEGSLGWQKYSITVSTLDVNHCVRYYEENNPDLLLLPFAGLKSLVGSFGHSAADYKKIYRQYQYLACKLYRETTDQKGNVTNEMAFLLEKYNKAIAAANENLVASGDAVSPVPLGNTKTDNWNTWLNFLKELDTLGYITLIEYSTANVK